MENDSILRQYKQAVDIGAIVSKTDSDGVLTYVNDNFCAASGFSREELLGTPYERQGHPDMPLADYQGMWGSVRSGKEWKGVVKQRKKNGEGYYVSLSVVPLQEISPRDEAFFFVGHEITECLQKEKEGSP